MCWFLLALCRYRLGLCSTHCLHPSACPMTTYYLESGKQERRNKICGGRHSAKGATSIQKPGATPQACTNIKPSALKARFTFGTSSMHEYLKSLRRYGADFDERYV